MKKHIFDAYDLSSIRTTSLEAIIPNRAAGYMKNAKDSILNASNYIALRPSGAFLSNINDLLKWEMVMQHNKLLTEKIGIKCGMIQLKPHIPWTMKLSIMGMAG